MGDVPRVDVTLPVSEVFGPVWQGEGPFAGRRCSFLRLGLCNLSCEWCDTPYTWDNTRFDVAAECPPRTVKDISGNLAGHGTTLTILSGGEPLMHQGNETLAEVVTEPGREWHVETNGTITPKRWLVDAVAHFMVSPKVSTHDPLSKRVKPMALTRFAELARAGQASFKFVASTGDHVAAAAGLVTRFDIPVDAVWIMPEGVTTDAILDHARGIASVVTAHGFNLTLRQHSLMYGTERAR